jgi:hypothetical protein
MAKCSRIGELEHLRQHRRRQLDISQGKNSFFF